MGSSYYPFIYFVHHTVHLYILFIILSIYIFCSSYCPFIYFVHHTVHLYILFIILSINIFCSSYYLFIYFLHHTVHLYILFIILSIYIFCSPYYPFIYFVHHTIHLYIFFTILSIYIFCSSYCPFIYFVHHTVHLYILFTNYSSCMHLMSPGTTKLVPIVDSYWPTNFLYNALSNPCLKSYLHNFMDFLSNFTNLNNKIKNEKRYASFFTGDCNGHSQLWCPDGDTTVEGSEIENFISSLGLSQLTSEPTNFEPNKRLSCIEVAITDQPNLVLDSGTRASLDSLCHHQITYCKENFNIYHHHLLKEKVVIMTEIIHPSCGEAL